MATTKPTESPDASTVTLDADLGARLVAALETIGSAIAHDEVTDARALSLLARLTGQNGSSTGPPPDPARSRAARDYDVLRGLLGRAGAPRGLPMHRQGNDILVEAPLPVSAAYAIVESPGTATTGPITERVDSLPSPKVPKERRLLYLHTITSDMPISRVELFDCDDKFIAFGPSLEPLVS